MAVLPSYSIGIEFVSGSYTEVGSDCIRFAVSRQAADAFNGLSPGAATFIFDNYGANYSPANSASPYNPYLIPNKAIRATATYDGSTYNIFNGFIDRFRVSPDLETRTVGIEASDRVKTLQLRNIDLPLTTNTNPGSLFVDILSAAAVTSAQRVVDRFYDSIPYAWDSDRRPLDAMDELMQFGYYRMFCGADGRINVKNRYWGIEGVTAVNSNNPAAQLNGTSGYIAISSFGLTSVNSTLTIEAWVKCSSSANNQTIVSDAAQAAGTGFIWMHRTSGNTGLAFQYATGAAIDVFTASNYFSNIDSISTHVAVVVDYANKGITFYRNGIPFSVQSTTNTMLYPSTNRLRYLGGYDFDNTSDFYSGVLDEVAIYQSGLPYARIQDHFNAATDKTRSYRAEVMADNPVGYWRLGETSGFSAADDSGNSHPGSYSPAGVTFGVAGLIADAFDYQNAFFGFDYSLDENKIINNIRISGQPRKLSTTVNTVAWIESIPTIPASSAIGFWLHYVDPVNLELDTPANSMVTPVNSTDYTTNTASDGTGTNRTSVASASVAFFGASAVCSIFNGSSDSVFLTKFQLRGYSVQRQAPILYETNDSSSQNTYGKRDFTLQSDYISALSYAQDYGVFMKTERKDPTADIEVSLKNVFPDVLARELGDIITLVESNTCVASNWTIRAINHEVSLARGLEHSASYGVEYWRDREYLILDHATRGLLNTGRLAF